MRITSETRTIALIGHPTAHSRSPQMHNAVLNKLKLPFVYLAYDIAPERLREAVRGMKALGFAGWNVTIPHKVSIMAELDELDREAEEIGAVNTVVNQQQKWVGYNTDGQGYLQSLKEEMGIDLRGKKVVLLGSGGAARSVGYALATAGIQQLVIANRTLAKAEKLADHLQKWTQVDFRPIHDCQQAIQEANLLVNTTSVGMHPHIEEIPINPNWLHRDCVVSDLIYVPHQTALLKKASEVGAHVQNGVGMLVHQAAIAFELWLGVKPPISTMRSVLEQSLHGTKA